MENTSNMTPEEQWRLRYEKNKIKRSENQRNISPEQREIRNKRHSEWKKKNRDKLNSYQQAYRDKNREKLNRERIYRQRATPEKRKIVSHRYNKNKKELNLKYYLVKGARDRARSLSLPFDLHEDALFVPEFCPVLGIKIIVGTGKPCPGSPTIDKIVPELGYTKENSRVISYRANVIKTNATPEELRLVAEYSARETARVLGK